MKETFKEYLYYCAQAEARGYQVMAPNAQERINERLDEFLEAYGEDALERLTEGYQGSKEAASMALFKALRGDPPGFSRVGLLTGGVRATYYSGECLGAFPGAVGRG